MIDTSDVGFDPTRDNAIVRDVESGDNGESDIETPNTNSSRSSLSTDNSATGAVVLGVGPDLESCKKGDIILYISGQSYTIDDAGTKVISRSSILAIGTNLRSK